tara:strand:- start:1309 stop:1545 length:237 start_codon:yes stop_codon:yes gene_type:complete
MYDSFFDSFFAPTRVIVVTEESLKQARKKAAEDQLIAIDNRIDELTKARLKVNKELEAYDVKPIEAGKAAKATKTGAK